MKKIALIFSVLTIALVSCKKEDTTPEPTPSNPTPTPSPYVTIGTATTSNNETVTLFADDDLSVGYTRLYFTVKDGNGTALTNATVDFAPLMDMGMMQHACPIEQPSYNSAIEMYEGALVFIMSSASGTWTLDVNVNGNPASFTLNVNDSPAGIKDVGTYTGTDGKVYIVSFKRPNNWVVGMNDFEILIHEKATMMSFPADDGFDITFEPIMTSMGHGSSGNIDPVNTANGHYIGEVNLSMPGDWSFHFELIKNGVTIVNDATLDILF